MSKEELEMHNTEKTCLDCLHCKVSKRTQKVRLCFCAKTKAKRTHKEPYWQANTICKKFEDMLA